MWLVLRLYGVDDRLLITVQSFREGRVCVRVGGEVFEWFDVKLMFREGCVMSL